MNYTTSKKPKIILMDKHKMLRNKIYNRKDNQINKKELNII